MFIHTYLENGYKILKYLQLEYYNICVFKCYVRT